MLVFLQQLKRKSVNFCITNKNKMKTKKEKEKDYIDFSKCKNNNHEKLRLIFVECEKLHNFCKFLDWNLDFNLQSYLSDYHSFLLKKAEEIYRINRNY